MSVCPSIWLGKLDGRTDTHTQTDDVKTVTPNTSETWGVIRIRLSHKGFRVLSFFLQCTSEHAEARQSC